MTDRRPFLATLHERASVLPDRAAFELAAGDGIFRLDYASVLDGVRRLGAALHAAGSSDGARVAVCMENRPSWPLAFLATWYAGGVSVPLDPAHDAATLGRLLEHSGAGVVVTSPRHLDRILKARAEVSGRLRILVTEPVDPAATGDAAARLVAWEGSYDGPRAEGSAGSHDRPEELPEDVDWLHDFVAAGSDERGEWEPRVTQDDFGTLIYTSGTTGDPKGVMLRREGFVKNIEGGLEQVEFRADDRILGILPLFHVLPLLTNCLGPLYLGATVVFLAELGAEAVMAAFRGHRITVFVCVPAFFYRFHDRLTSRLVSVGPVRRRLAAVLLAVCRQARRHLGIRLGHRLLGAAHEPFGDAMRLFITGGAKMSADVIEEFLDWGFILAQGYGLTESTAILTATPLDELRGDTVGRPIAGVELRIREPDDRGIGEIEARGPSLMLGYYRNPEATDEVLVDGWLRTGDVGEILENGHLRITGRAKDVVVLPSGKNVYPDEIEEVYGRGELVDEICVLGLPHPDGRGERLHAVVVPDMEEARSRGYVNVRDMVKWELESLGGSLPAHSRITSLEVRNRPLPRTPTRKVKRFELVEEILERRRAGEDGAAAEKAAGEGVAAAEEAAGEGREIVPPADAATAGGDKGQEEETADAASARADGPRDAPREEGRERPDVVAGDELSEGGRQVLELLAAQAGVTEVGRDDHLDLDLGLGSLDRVELLAEIEARLAVHLDEERGAEIHTVGELLDAVEERGEGAGEPAAGAGEDRWREILQNVPEGIKAHLVRRPVSEAVLVAAATVGRWCWSLAAGFRSGGQESLPRDGAFLLCPNHLSYTDPFFVAMALPPRVLRRCFYVGYSEYFESGAGRLVSRWMRNVPIDANRNLERALQAAAEGLRRGLVLVIFPEGGRSIDGDVKEFRRGAAILARQLDLPLVPVGIWGTFQVWPRGGRFRRHPVAIAIGSPLTPAPDEEDDGASPDIALTRRLRSRVIDRAGEARRLGHVN